MIRAPVQCPLCALAAPGADEVEGVATVVGVEDERGAGATLDAFECEGSIRHTEDDLSAKQTRALLGIALEYLADVREAMASAHWDDAHDRYREEGW